jgi:CBS domain containing-hemolysin-like protein
MRQLILATSLAMGVSALCSLFEAVLYSVPISYVEALARKGRRSGVLFKRMREKVERPISAVLTLNTVANTFGAAVAGAAALAVFGKEWLGVFSAAFTLGILLFSEIIPKTVGVRYCKGFSKLVALPLYLLQWVLSPAIWATSWITRWFGNSGSLEGISAEEIQVMARMGHSAGAIRSVEEKVIRNILVLRKVRSRDIMTPRTVVYSLPKNISLEEVRATSPLWPWPHSRVPVYDGEIDNIVGLVRRREVLSALADGRQHLRLSDLMRQVHIVPDTLTADRLLKDFIERREHLFVVVDEYGGVAGVVTLEDVFEEILGQEIVDETDLTDDLQRVAHQRRRKILGEDESAS